MSSEEERERERGEKWERGRRETEQRRGESGRQAAQVAVAGTACCCSAAAAVVMAVNMFRISPFAAVLWPVLAQQQSLCAAGRQRGGHSVRCVCCLSTLCALMHAMHKTVS